MSNCKLQTLYFATTELEVLDEFEGEKGTFIKSFLINDKLNLNDWEVTAEANRLDGPDFVGMPGIEFFNKGRRDHTVGNTYQEALRLQTPHAKAVIRKVLGTETGGKLEQVSRVFDEKMIQFLRNKKTNGEKMFVSPAIFPRSIDDVQIIEKPDGSHIHRVHRYLPLHYAFVDEPAYGRDAEITDICEGADCLLKLSKANTDGIGQDDIEPLREIPIIRVSRCSKTGKVLVSVSGNDELSKLVSECLSEKLQPGEEPTDQELAICFSESREKLKKSNTSEIQGSKKYGKKLPDEFTKEDKEKLEARIAQLEDNEKKREEEAKKSKKAQNTQQNEDNNEENMLETGNIDEEDTPKEKLSKKSKKAKKGQDEETEKEKEQTAKIATLTKIANTPIIEQYLAAKKMIGATEEQLTEIENKMMSASVEENQAKLDEIKPFLAQLQFNEQAEQKSAGTKYPMGLGETQLSGSSNKSAEEMFTELYE